MFAVTIVLCTRRLQHASCFRLPGLIPVVLSQKLSCCPLLAVLRE